MNNWYLIAKVGADTADNGPTFTEIATTFWQISAHSDQNEIIFAALALRDARGRPARPQPVADLDAWRAL